MTVNDSFFSVLSGYDGSVDDRKKKYLVATESYSDSLSVQDMEKTKLTALGYTGSLNDMWSQYLISLGGTGLDSMSSLLSSTFYSGSSGSGINYAVQSVVPTAIADFVTQSDRTTAGEYFQLSGAEATFGAMFNWTGGLTSFFNSSGVLVRNCIQLAANPNSPATQSITVQSGAKYTVEMTGTGSVTLSGAGSGTVTDGSPVEITASTTSLTLTVSGSPTRMWAYNSDLGGMAPNPDDGTTFAGDNGASPLYLPPRNAYRHNGTSWVRKGIARNSAAATQTLTYANDYSNVAWGKVGGSVAQDATGIDGETSAWTFTTSTTSARITRSVTVATSTTYTYSRYFKAGTNDWIALVTVGFTTPGNVYTWFDGSTGSIGTVGTGHTARIQNCGNGLYRASITFTTDAADTTGDVWTIICSGNVSTTCSSGVTQILTADQFEVGSVPTPYIPTNGSTITRIASTLPADTSVRDAVYNASGMSGAHKGLISYADTGSTAEAAIVDIRVDANNRIIVKIDTSGANTGVVKLQMLNGGSLATAQAVAELTPGIDVVYNVAWRVTGSEISISLNGATAVTTVTAIGIPDLSTATINDDGNLIRELDRYWPSDIGTVGLVEATT